ncbi:hypothetical protein CP533_4875 [Ophiocordyceps camponoti-saundersi (nom. inval.)]|nr:hypothetical protein CP533_4875 [Ophiocordyceps camponoti-saundersi (nom. inval.)]
MLIQKASPLTVSALDQASRSMLECLPWESCGGAIQTELDMMQCRQMESGSSLPPQTWTKGCDAQKLDPDPGGRKTARKSVRSVLLTSVARKGAAKNVAGDVASDSTGDAAKDDAAKDFTKDAAREAAWKAVTEAVQEATKDAASNAVKDIALSVPSRELPAAAVHAPLVIPKYAKDAREDFYIVRVPRRRHTRLDPSAKALQAGTHQSSCAAPDRESTTQVVPAATSKMKIFEAAAFDAALYSQAGAMKPPAGVSIQSRRRAWPRCADDDRVYLHANPAIHRSHNRSEEWHEEKTREIKARGGRKAWFGKPVQRIRWMRLQESQSKNKGERLKTPQPWTFSRPLDFGDVPESKLPDDVRKDPAWLKSCAWHREMKRMRDLREHEARRSERETRQFYVDFVDSMRPTLTGKGSDSKGADVA